MTRGIGRKYKEGIYIGIVVGISLILTYLFLDLGNMEINIPYYTGNSGGDALFIQSTVKSIEDFGWYHNNPNLGAPFGATQYDFPFYGDTFHLLVLKVLAIISGGYGSAINIFYIALFPITALISYKVMVSLKVNNIISILGSLAFTFLPYRLLRNQMHLFLSAYYFIPLAVLIIIWLYNDETFFVLNKKFFKNKKNIIGIIYLVLIALSGIYYAFFMCFFIALTTFIKILRGKQKIRYIIQGMLIVGIIGTTIGISMLPNIIYNSKYGINQEQPKRNPIESEMFGMKVTQLYIPNNTHNIGFIEKIHEKYSQAPLPNEGSEYLGIVGAVGFTYLLINLFKRNKEDKNKEIISLLAELNIAAVLLATIGGFGSIFALIISPQIRAYNRISVYIAYFSILGICIFISNYTEQLKRKKIIWFIIIGMFFISIFEQIPNMNVDLKNMQTIYNSDREFVGYIENQVSENAMIFQMPYYKFPESPPQNAMGDYSLFRGYLHSDTLKWSYGGYRGRVSDLWNRYVSSLDISDMIETLSIVGFEGIYIDRSAYTEEEITELENKLQEILGEAVYTSTSSNLSFFNMKAYNNRLREEYDTQELNEMKDKALNIILFKDTGLYDTEGVLDNKFNWSNKSSQIKITNLSDMTKKIRLKMIAYSGYEDSSILQLDMAKQSNVYEISNKGTAIEVELEVSPGENILQLSTDAQQVNVPGDMRELYFRISNISLQ